MTKVFGHSVRKRFGQNFLHDNNIIHKIVAAIAPQKNQHVVEIGPGLGALTYALLPLVEHLDAIEIDRDLIERLTAAPAAKNKLQIYEQDALTFDFTTLGVTPLRLIGNLPYNISTPLIFHCLEQIPQIYDMHFMLQKEVVERICTAPNTSEYGRLSVMVQYYCTATSLFTVPATAFRPQPRVESAIIRLVPNAQRALNSAQELVFAQVVKQAFSQRRKTLRNVLKDLISEAEFSQIGIDPQARAQTLRVQDFIALTMIISARSI